MDIVDRWTPYFVAIICGAIMGSVQAPLWMLMLVAVFLVVWGCWWRFLRKADNG